MKIRDEIVCINELGSENLERNKVYTIVDINEHGNIGLKDQETGCLLAHYYKPERFKLKPIRHLALGQIYRRKGYNTYWMIMAIGNEYSLRNISGGVGAWNGCKNTIEDIFIYGYDQFELTWESLDELLR